MRLMRMMHMQMQMHQQMLAEIQYKIMRYFFSGNQLQRRTTSLQLLPKARRS
jgi:hypothetical protein